MTEAQALVSSTEAGGQAVKRSVRIADTCAIAALLSIVIYAFAGVGVWAMLPDTGTGFARGYLLFVLHLVALMSPLFVRSWSL